MSIQKIATSNPALNRKISFRQTKKQFKSKKMRVLCKKITVGDFVTLRNGLTGEVKACDLYRSLYCVTSTVHPQPRNYINFDWYYRDGKSAYHKSIDIIFHKTKRAKDLENG